MFGHWWYLILGLLLVSLGVGNARLKRLPLTVSIVYLGLGYLLGPRALGMLELDPLEDSAMLERVTEIAVIVSLFTAGLKLRAPLRDRLWREPVQLATLSMTLTVALIAWVGVEVLGLSLGVAILLGAVLAPTDPVLASEVQVVQPGDRDRMRFALTGEAGLNDGTAFPFVMLGLGVLGLHEIGPSALRWLLVDVLWAGVGGLAIGALLGTGVAVLISRVRVRADRVVILDDFVAIGLIGLSYGAALLMHTYGFLAVFAAGLAMRQVERSHRFDGAVPDESVVQPLTADPSSLTAHKVLLFNEQLERISEVAVVILIGSMLSISDLPIDLLWFAPILFLVVRPLAVGIGLARSGVPRVRLFLMSWFGIRGIGSIYYLMYAIERGVREDEAASIAGLVLGVVAISVIVHGITVTPLMKRYERRTEDRSA